MKLQGMSIIYVLIVLPILFVITLALSVYSSSLRLKTEYDKKLLGSAQDAIRAFELNTAGEDYSKVNDVLRSIIEASNNVFKDSLATKIGLSNVSRQRIDQNMVLGLFTLYDGFYISMPSKEPEVVTGANGVAKHIDDSGVSASYGNNANVTSVNYNVKEDISRRENKEPNTSNLGKAEEKSFNDYKPVVMRKKENGYTTNFEQAKTNEKHQLKNMIPYSAYYKLKNGYASVNYTLDNFLTINGKINDELFTKKGYLLDSDTEISSVVIGSNSGDDGKKASILKDSNQGNDEIIDRYLEEARNKKIPVTIKVKNARIEKQSRFNTYLSNEENNKNEISELEIKYDPADEPSGNKPVRTLNELEKYYKDLSDYEAKKAYADQQINAIKYYLKSVKFTSWMNNMMGDITLSNIDLEATNPLYQTDARYKDGGGADIYDIGNHKNLYPNRPIFKETEKGKHLTDPNSYFNLHRRLIIKNAIIYNLLVSTINYNLLKYGEGSPRYQLPSIKEADWDTILRTVSYTAFIEGFDLGVAKYNDYKTVGSTNNNFVVTENSMAFVAKDDYNKGLTDRYYVPISEVRNANQTESEKYVSNLFNGTTKILGRAENKFINDGSVKKDANSITIFNNKNYRIPGVGITDIGNSSDRTDYQKKIIAISLSSEKETQVKMMDYTINSTVYQSISKESEQTVRLRDIHSSGKWQYNIPSTESSNKGIKSIQISYKFKDINPGIIINGIRDLTKSKNIQVTFDLNLEDASSKVSQTIPVKIRTQSGDAYQIETIRNGQLETKDSSGIETYNAYDPNISKVSISNLKVKQIFGTWEYDITENNPELLNKYQIEIGNVRVERY